MFQDRKEYRKNFNSSGQLHLAGETLEFMSHDVSVNGILIEVKPGRLLASFDDFEKFLKENAKAELFVKDLMLTGEAEVMWVRNEDGKIIMGLEFREVMHNAERLWLKRQYYRKEQAFSGYLIMNNRRIDFEGLNVSVDGLMIYLKESNECFAKGSVTRLFSEALHIKALAKICWVKKEGQGGGIFIGLRYLSGE